jgi:hypothetical protein
MQNIVKEFENAYDLVELNYQGQNPRHMNTYLIINWEDKTVDIENRNYQIVGTPSKEWNGLITSICLPTGINAVMARFTVDELLPVISERAKHFESVWDGSNYKGQFDDDEYGDATWELDELVKATFDNTTDDIGVMDLCDWFVDCPVTAGSTDAEIEEIANTAELDAKGMWQILDTSTESVKEFLTRIRDELRDEEE